MPDSHTGRRVWPARLLYKWFCQPYQEVAEEGSRMELGGQVVWSQKLLITRGAPFC